EAATTRACAAASRVAGAARGRAPAEHATEQVLEPARAAGARTAAPGCEARSPTRHGADRVVLTALLRVGEHGISLADLLEARLSLVVTRVVVGVMLPRELAVGLLDRGLVGVLGHAERRVEVLLEPVLAGQLRLLRWSGVP